MNKIHLISYSEDRMFSFAESRKRVQKEAEDFGEFDSITLCNENDLDDSVKEIVKPTLEQPRGAGYWIWKPFIIQKKLKELDEGDFLIYMDMGITLNKHAKKNFYDLLGRAQSSNHGTICFEIGHTEKHWCVKEIFEHLECSDNETIKNTDQYYAGLLIFCKNKNLINLIDEWCDIAYNNPMLFSDELADDQDFEFKENRHDQAVFSVLRKTKNVQPIIYDPIAYDQWELRKSYYEAAFWNLHLRS
tara:strand:+ start:852 stop:1589 length:738 start_codon:yes stop_codon:yes gene_type:complete